MNKELKKILKERVDEGRSLYCEMVIEKLMSMQDLAAITAILGEYGIELEIKNEREGKVLSIWTKPEYHLERNTRNAGRRKTFALQKNQDGESLSEFYKYSDVVYMMQSKKDDEIMEILGMAAATYYRHKKTMKESEYYKNLEQSKLADQDYLKSVEGDYIF
jgi:hypothetical protein